MNKDFEGFNWGKEKIIIKPPKNFTPLEVRPVQIHLKEDGSLNDEPSFVIVSDHVSGLWTYGQISFKMFNEGLNDIGYELRKRQ